MTTRVVLATVIGASVCAAAASLAAAQAQAPRQQPPVFRTNTELVEIDVVVIDKNGERVHGLTKDDFVLRDRRQPQTIETFTEVRRDVERLVEGPRLPATIRADVASNTSAQAGRLVVLVLDDLHVWQGRTDTVKEIARKIVTDLGPESSMALIQTGGDHSTEVTNDRTRLLESIDHFKGRRPVRRPIEACEPDSTTQDLCDIQFVNANRSLYKALQDAARVLGTHDKRRKAFILVSENFSKELSGLFQGGTQRPGPPPSGGGYYQGVFELIPRQGSVSSLDWALLDMMNAMRRGNIATYAIDPKGEVTSQDLEYECHPSPPGPPDDPCLDPFVWTSWIRKAQNGLRTITEETGGFAVVNTDDFTSGIGQIIDDLDTYYLLGFYPTDLTGKGYRAVEVEVKGRPDLTLRFRRGYEVRADDEPAERANRDPLATLISGALPSADLPLRLHAIPMPYAGNRSRVAISLELTLPRTTLANADSERLLDEIRYGVFAVDLKGAKVREQTGSGARVALRPRPGLIAPPDHVSYQIALELELPAGRYQLRASAQSDKLAAAGSVYLSVDVPDYSREDLALTDLLLAYADGPHVPVARDLRRTNPAVGHVRQTNRAAPPLAVAPALPFEPALDRTFSRHDTLRLFAKAVQRVRRPLTATISAQRADSATAITVERTPGSDGSFDIRLPLAQLTPGAYALTVTVSDGTRTASKDLGFVVR